MGKKNTLNFILCSFLWHFPPWQLLSSLSVFNFIIWEENFTLLLAFFLQLVSSRRIVCCIGLWRYWWHRACSSLSDHYPKAPWMRKISVLNTQVRTLCQGTSGLWICCSSSDVKHLSFHLELIWAHIHQFASPTWISDYRVCCETWSEHAPPLNQTDYSRFLKMRGHCESKSRTRRPHTARRIES